ncbi:MAG: hypothetical protein ABIX46_02830 [Burkholderiaceae bacterium]
MHHDRISAKLNPNKRENRHDGGRPWRDHEANDSVDTREHGVGKAQRTFGARQQEAMHQIRELGARDH